MNTSLSLRLLGGLVLGVLLGGCLNLTPEPDHTRYFTLSPRQFAAVASYRVQVDVTRIPYYTRTKRIAFRKGANEIAYFPYARWSGPLEIMLADRVRERLEPWAASVEGINWRIRLDVIACEGGEDGQANFAADYTIWKDDGADPIVEGRFLDSTSWQPDAGAEQLVGRLGVMTDALADLLASEMTQYR